MSTQTEFDVTFTNSGPIEGEFEVSITGPGLYELRGSKGKGKTSVLAGLSILSGHKVDLTVHDGELSGEIRGFGVVAPIGRKKRRGKVEVDVIPTEKFDLVDLIDPDGKTPETRDATRIKALVSLLDVSIGPKDFYSLMGGESSFDGLGIEPTDDPILFATRIKRSIDSEAKGRENVANSHYAHATALLEAVDKVDLTAPCSAHVLAHAVESATVELATLCEQVAAAEKGEDRHREAEKKYSELQGLYQGPTGDQAQFDYDVAAAAVEERKADVEDIERLLREAKAKLGDADTHWQKMELEFKRAIQHENDISQWAMLMKEGILVAPSADEIVGAEIAKKEALRLQEEGVRIRDAKGSKVQADQHRLDGVDAEGEASRLRAAAAGVFGVVTEKLKTKVIRVEDVAGSPRLVVDHPERGKTLFDQLDGLSDGERVRSSIDELLPHLKSPGLFPIPQRTYQDLPPRDRRELARYAEENGLFVFGAQVTDGELRVEKIRSDDDE